MFRIGTGALFLLAGAAAAHAQGYGTNFDGGTAGWTLDAAVNGSAWAADATPAGFPGGPSRSGLSLNFNNGTDYAGGTSGAALSPVIGLAGLTNPILTFWCNYNTETRGTAFDRRRLQVLDGALTVKYADWQLATTGYSFNARGGFAGAGPGPCSEAYNDLETGTPVNPWHQHRIFLDPAWGPVRLRFVFWSVDDLRNGYAGWAIDDLFVYNNGPSAMAGWPDVHPDTSTEDGDGNELDVCERRVGDFITWSWGSTVTGDPNVHLIVGTHPQTILDRSFMFYDPVHLHWHLTQFVDFALWKQQAFGFQKLRRGPKRSFCLADTEQVIPGTPKISPGCDDLFEAISYGWQDVYGIGTPGQAIDVAGLATDTDYWLIGVQDPLNRMRETVETNQVDQIHFTLPATAPQQVAILDRANPYPQGGSTISITAATVGVFQGVPAVQVLGAGFDTTLAPVLYDAGTAAEEAPMFTIVGPGEIWVEIPGAIATPASIDLLRARGDAASFRIGGAAPTPTPPPAELADFPPMPVGDNDDNSGHHDRCGALGLELALLALLLRRRTTRR